MARHANVQNEFSYFYNCRQCHLCCLDILEKLSLPETGVSQVYSNSLYVAGGIAGLMIISMAIVFRYFNLHNTHQNIKGDIHYYAI